MDRAKAIAMLRQEVDQAITRFCARVDEDVEGRPPRVGRRTHLEIDALTIEVLDYITARPNERIEQIAIGLKRHTGELKLPIKRLLQLGDITARGRRRGMSYAARQHKGDHDVRRKQRRRQQRRRAADAAAAPRRTDGPNDQRLRHVDGQRRRGGADRGPGRTDRGAGGRRRR